MVLEEQQLKERIFKIAEDNAFIQGWLHNDAGSFLYQLARFHAPIPTVVELGSWKGRSTSWLASGMKDRGEGLVYAVDTWQGTPGEMAHEQLLKDYDPDQLFNEFLGNMKQLELHEWVTPIRMDTLSAAKHWIQELPDMQIGVLFIDAGHEYEQVLHDFESWSPMVAKNGFIVFDDVPAWPGPTKVVFEMPRWYKQVGTTPNNVAFQKMV